MIAKSYESQHLSTKVKANLVEGSLETERQFVDVMATTKIHDTNDLVSLALQIEQAESFTKANATNKLALIADQIRSLAEKAKEVLLEAKRDNDLHHIQCNFKKVPGHTYHHYKNGRGIDILSMLSPDDWGESNPYTYINSYRLEGDMSWTPLSDIQNKDSKLTYLESIISDSHAKSLTFSVNT